jgi:predicted nucleic acid-binding protein
MGLKVSVDTNLFIEVKNKEGPYEFSKSVLDMIDSGQLTCALSTVVVAEMCSGYHMTGELREKDEFLAHIAASQNYEIVELSIGLADDAARIRAATELKLPDAIIVASAMGGEVECLISNDSSLKKAEKFMRVLTAREFLERSGKPTRK